MSTTKVGNCTFCGKDAAWNTPYINSRNELICSCCSHDSPELLMGVEQHMKDGKYQFSDILHYTQYGIIVWRSLGKCISAWYNNGSTAYILSEEEKDLDAKELIEKIKLMLIEGKFKCTTCEKIFPNDAEGGRPLFAGRVCKICWELHQAQLDQEKKDGHVCRMCGQPWGACCC